MPTPDADHGNAYRHRDHAPLSPTQQHPTASNRPLVFYPGNPPVLPRHIPRDLLVLEWVEALPLGVAPEAAPARGSGRRSKRRPRLERLPTSSLSLSLLTNATHPAVFVINLDRRADRLAEFAARWAGSTIQALRVAARPHTSLGHLRLNGCSLSHVALLLAMERFGWPYILVLEDDADPTPAWPLLLPPILEFVRARRGDVGWVNLAPSYIFGPLDPEVQGALWRVEGGFLVSQANVYGRRMVAAAHAFLDTHAAPGLRGPGVVNDYAWGRLRTGIGPGDLLAPAAVMAVQRPSFSDLDGSVRNHSQLWAASDRGLAAAAKRHGWPALAVPRVA